MWHLQGKLTNTVGAQLNAILDPLTKPRSTTIEDEDGTTTQIPDERPHGQRLHDALDEACARLLKMADQPSARRHTRLGDRHHRPGGSARQGWAGRNRRRLQLTPDQLLRIADEAEIWPTIINQNGVPLALGRTRRIASPGQTMALIVRDAGCSFPGCTHPPS